MHFDNNSYKAVCTSDQMYEDQKRTEELTHIPEQTTLLHFIALILLWPRLVLLDVEL